MSNVLSSTSTTGSSTAAQEAAGVNSAFAKLGPDDFLKMMIAQLQNQDPLSPADSSQMLQELNVMSQVSSTQTLNGTLNSVLLGQNLSNASGLIGATVKGLSDASQQITGTVDSVTITGGTPVLNIGSDTMSLDNIEDILPYGSAAAASGTGTSSTDTSGSGSSSTDGSTTGATAGA